MKTYINKIIIFWVMFTSFSSLTTQEINEKQAINNQIDKHETKKEINPEDEETIKLKKQIEKIKLEKEVIKINNDLNEEKFRTQIFELDKELRLLNKNNIRENENYQKEINAFKKEKDLIILKQSRLNLANTRLLYKKNLLDTELSQLKIEIAERENKKIWNSKVNKEIIYTKTPFQNNKLNISDRRIDLNGVIDYDMADEIVKKIEFFNNKSAEFPIFIVIDSSPGGSVMAGYQIVMAMKSSRAPIHVVAKSYAASMAAMILAYAENSYIFRNTIILHHQVSGFAAGNITQQKEMLKITEEWMERIAAPVAQKMGITLEKFVKMMYEKNSDGDWREFGDAAVSIKWADHLLDEVYEQSVVEPIEKKEDEKKGHWWRNEKKDNEGKSFISLPRLNPYDVYFLYNPDGYFRYP